MKPKHIILSTLAIIGAVLACGPYYPYRILDVENPTIAPAPSSLADMFPENDAEATHRFPMEEKYQITLKADLADLKLAAPDLAPKSFDAYKELREEMMEAYLTQVFNAADEKLDQPKPDLALLNQLPKEFQHYVKGAHAYNIQDFEAARKHWQQLLDLPPAERKYRTTWALWMLTRTTKGEDNARWIDRLELELKNGAADSLDLAHSLAGMRAHHQYRNGQPIPALQYYIRAGETGKISPLEAATSLNTVFTCALTEQKDNQFHENLLQHPEIRKYFARYLERTQPSHLHEQDEIKPDGPLFLWVSFLLDKNAELHSEEAATLAAACYRAQWDEFTDKLLAKVTADTPDSLFIRAKLAVKHGRLIEAENYYKQLTQSIDPTAKGATEEWEYATSHRAKNARTNQAYSEYAAICLALKKYESSLLLFLKAGNFSDAGYIAENLLTAPDLLVICRKHFPKEMQGDNGSSKWIRNVLGRRLSREQYFKDAASFIPQDQVEKFDAYVTLYRQAHNKNLPRHERGLKLWTLAQSHYQHGHDLFWLTDHCRPITRVKYANLPMSDERKSYYSWILERPSKPIIPAISADELSRLRKNYTPIARPAAHVYAASEFAYQAAALLPDNDPQTAKILWQAGSWIKIGDPKRADKFYQALVRRCPMTPLGQLADKKRWFPEPGELESILISMW